MSRLVGRSVLVDFWFRNRTHNYFQFITCLSHFYVPKSETLNVTIPLYSFRTYSPSTTVFLESDIHNKRNYKNEELLNKLIAAKQDQNTELFSILLKENATVRVSSHFLGDLYPHLSSEWLYQFKSREIPRLFYAFGKIGYDCKQKKHLGLFTRMIACTIPYYAELSGMEISMIYSGCANANMYWNQLKVTESENMQKLILSGGNKFYSRELTNILHALQKMHAKWTDLHIDVRGVLLRRLMHIGASFDAQSRALTIYSLGKLGVQIDTLTDRERDAVYDMTVKMLMTTEKEDTHLRQHIANTFLGLANMGVSYVSLPQSLQQTITHCLENIMYYGEEQQVANTIHALGMMKVPWSSLTVDCQLALQTAFITTSSAMLQLGVMQTLYGLSEMGMSWNYSRMEFRQAALQAIERLLKDINSTAISSSGVQSSSGKSNRIDSTRNSQFINTLSSSTSSNEEDSVNSAHSGNNGNNSGQIELTHSSNSIINSTITTTRPVVYGHLKHEYIMQDITAIVYSLGVCGVQWSDLPVSLVNELSTAMSRFQGLTNHRMSMVTLGFALMHVQWQQLPRLIQQSLLREMSKKSVFSVQYAQYIVNTVWGLGSLQLCWNIMHIHVRNNIEHAIIQCASQFTAQDVTNVMLGLAQLNVHWNVLTKDTKEALTLAIVNEIENINIQDCYALSYAISLLTFDAELHTTQTIHTAFLAYLHDNMHILHQTDITGKSHIAIYLELLSTIYPHIEEVQQLLLLVTERMKIDKHETDVKTTAIELELAHEKSKVKDDKIYLLLQLIEPECVVTPETKYTEQIMTISEKITSELNKSYHSTMLSNINNTLHNKCTIKHDQHHLTSSVFSVDITVYYDNKIVAFIELDNESKYTTFDCLDLKRENKLKAYLYAQRYPKTPFLRVKSRDLDKGGVDKVVKPLINRIVNDLSVQMVEEYFK